MKQASVDFGFTRDNNTGLAFIWPTHHCSLPHSGLSQSSYDTTWHFFLYDMVLNDRPKAKKIAMLFIYHFMRPGCHDVMSSLIFIQKKTALTLIGNWIIKLAGLEAHASSEDCWISVINYKADVIRWQIWNIYIYGQAAVNLLIKLVMSTVIRERKSWLQYT